MAGCAATGTLATVTPADAFALNAIAVQANTLPAVTVQPTSVFNAAAIPGMLKRLRRVSGLHWGDLARAVGVSRRTIHNWLGGARVADVHLARLVEVSRAIDLVANGSPESTRAALLEPTSNGRSIIEGMALMARPTRARPISIVSVGDLVAPINESERFNPKVPQRRSSVRGGSLPTRQSE
jgi:transcriptional regulator with XRE-family HTH domain